MYIRILSIASATICLSITPIGFAHAVRYEVYAAQLQTIRKTPLVRTKTPSTQAPSAASRRRRSTTNSTLFTKPTTQKIQKESSANTHSIIDAVNTIRSKKQLAPLVIHDGLSKVAQRQLDSNVTVFDQSALEKFLDAERVNFKVSAEECNCAGTSSTYRQIVIKRQSDDYVLKKIHEDYNSIFLMENYQYIGVYELDKKINIILGGSKDIAFTPFTDAQIHAFRSEILQIVNKERSTVGLSKLQMNQKLESSAQAYATRMWNDRFYAHISPDGLTLEDRVSAEKYFDIDLRNCNCKSAQFYIGENIAKGQKSAIEVMTDWMNSPGHRKNILSPDFTEIGIGIYGNRWVQNFGTAKIVK